MHIHIEVCNGVLHALALVFDYDRMTDALDTNLVDCQLAGVGRILNLSIITRLML